MEENIIRNLENATKNYEDTTKKIIDELSKKNIKTDSQTQDNTKSKIDINTDIDNFFEKDDIEREKEEIEDEFETDLQTTDNSGINIDQIFEVERGEKITKETKKTVKMSSNILYDYYYDFNPNVFYKDIGVNQYFSKKK